VYKPVDIKLDILRRIIVAVMGIKGSKNDFFVNLYLSNDKNVYVIRRNIP
jgi:hypothetical protein